MKSLENSLELVKGLLIIGAMSVGTLMKEGKRKYFDIRGIPYEKTSSGNMGYDYRRK